MTSIGANMLFFAQYFQLVEGLSPLHAGLWMLPGVGAGTCGFLLSPHLARRFRPAHLIAAGLLLALFGFLVVANTSVGLFGVVLGFVLMNFGCSPLVTLGIDFIVGSAPVEKAGSAAAISETTTELGFALGIAALGSLAAAIYGAALPVGVPPAARESLASASAFAATMQEPLAQTLLTTSRAAFIAGMHGAALVSAAILLGVTIVVMTGLRHVAPLGQAQAEPAASALEAAPACV